MQNVLLDTCNPYHDYQSFKREYHCCGLKSMADVEIFAQSDFRSNGFTKPSLMIEGYVEGKLYHVDGFCYDNQVKYLSCGAYIHGLIDDFYQNFHLARFYYPISQRFVKN